MFSFAGAPQRGAANAPQPFRLHVCARVRLGRCAALRHAPNPPGSSSGEGLQHRSDLALRVITLFMFSRTVVDASAAVWHTRIAAKKHCKRTMEKTTCDHAYACIEAQACCFYLVSLNQSCGWFQHYKI